MPYADKQSVDAGFAAAGNKIKSVGEDVNTLKEQIATLSKTIGSYKAVSYTHLTLPTKRIV